MNTNFDLSVLFGDTVGDCLAAAAPRPTGLRLSDLGGRGDFARRLGADPRNFVGTVDTVCSTLLDSVLGSSDTYPVQETDAYATLGTIFSPAQFLRIGDEIVAGPVFHGQVTIKRLFEADADLGDFYVMAPYAFQVMLLSKERTTIVKVRAAAALALGLELQKSVCERRSGLAIKGKLFYDGRLADRVMAVSGNLVDPLCALLSKQSHSVVTADTLSGIHMVCARSPITDLDCLPSVRVVVLDAPESGIWCNDITAKLMGGDFDGDPVALTFRRSYRRSSLRADMGTMPRLGLNPDPTTFGPLGWSVSKARGYMFQTGKKMAVGLAVKSLFQGLLTNYFAAVAASAVALSAEDEAFCTATTARLTAKGYVVTDRTSLLIALMDAIKRNETVMTEVIMDFRKHELGAQGQYSEELFHMARVAGRTAPGGKMPKSASLIVKGGKEFDAEMVDALLASLPLGSAGSKKLTPADHLKGLPLQRMVVLGAQHLGTSDSAANARMDIAYVIANLGGERVLRCLSGQESEGFIPVMSHGARVNEAHPAFAPVRPVFNGNAWEYVAAAVRAIDPALVSYTKLPVGASFRMPNGSDLVLPWGLDISLATRTGRASYVTVKTGGGSRFSRLTVRPVVRNLADVSPDFTSKELIEEYGVEVVSFLDQIAEMVCGLRADVLDALRNKEVAFSTPQWEREGLERRTALLNEHCRLPGQSNKGDEIVHGRIETTGSQISIEPIHSADAVANYHALVALAECIDNAPLVAPLVDPLSGNILLPFVGATSKSKPMTVCFLRRADRAFPEHVYAVNQFIGNTDRILRESGTPLQACKLQFPSQVITTGRSIGPLAERRLDALWAMVAGTGWLMSDGAHNGDQGRLTPSGTARYATKPLRKVFRALSEEALLAKASEYVGECADVATALCELEFVGWDVTPVNTPLAGKSGQAKTRLSTRTYDLVSPEFRDERSLYKIWLSGGHKFLAPQTRKNYFVVIDGERVAVDGLVSRETMVGFQDGDDWDGGKKQDLTVLAGLLSALGKTDWTGQEVLEIEALKAETSLALAAHDLPASGALTLFDEDGNAVGECVPMLLPSYVCFEGDQGTGVVENGFMRSLNVTRLLGEDVSLTPEQSARIQGLADTAAGRVPDGPLRSAVYGLRGSDEYSAQFPFVECESLPLLPQDRVTPEMDRAMYPRTPKLFTDSGLV